MLCASRVHAFADPRLPPRISREKYDCYAICVGTRRKILYFSFSLQSLNPFPRSFHIFLMNAPRVLTMEKRKTAFPANFNAINCFVTHLRYHFRSRNTAKSRDNQGSTRLPPLPMPSFPKFNQSNYQPNKMTYDELVNFR